MSQKVYGPTIQAINTSGQRNIYVSTSTPTSSQGQEGDIWLVYTP
jgi:hypothetical protein